MAIEYGKAAPQAISWVGGGPVMQVRGGYASMICHALNGLTGGGGQCRRHPGEQQGIYRVSFPKPDDFMDDIAKKGKKHEKIDHRGRQGVSLP